MSNIFFISDLHLGHRGVLKWGKPWRKGETQEEHDQWIIDSINSVVRGKNDRLYILGDVSWRVNKLFMLDQLKCQDLFLVRGNHDDLPTAEYLQYFKEIYGVVKYKSYWLSHAPIHPDELRGCGNIHGHVHSQSIVNIDLANDVAEYDKRYINVSIEAINSIPVSLEELRSGAYWRRKVT